MFRTSIADRYHSSNFALKIQRKKQILEDGVISHFQLKGSISSIILWFLTFCHCKEYSHHIPAWAVYQSPETLPRNPFLMGTCLGNLQSPNYFSVECLCAYTMYKKKLQRLLMYHWPNPRYSQEDISTCSCDCRNLCQWWPFLGCVCHWSQTTMVNWTRCSLSYSGVFPTGNSTQRQSF